MNKSILKRKIDLRLPPGKSCFLWGPRQAVKSYWIRHHLKAAKVIDLLQTEVFAEYAVRPSLLRERLADVQGLIVIDEVQKVPPASGRSTLDDRRARRAISFDGVQRPQTAKGARQSSWGQSMEASDVAALFYGGVRFQT